MTPNPGKPDDDEDVEQIKANGRNNDQIRDGDQTIHACVFFVGPLDYRTSGKSHQVALSN